VDSLDLVKEPYNLNVKSKMIFDFVFVVLVYRNTQDLEDFFSSLSLKNSKVIVVNSYYDETSEQRFREISLNNNADFLSVPNKGYGAGNNRGCEYALKNYHFRYLIISNADVEIIQLNTEQLSKYNNSIIAPKILTLFGKNQNPFMPYYSTKVDIIKNWAYTHRSRLIILILSALARIIRELYLRLLFPLFRHRRIYAAHGAFVILPFEFVYKFSPIYNERMFLFAEEEHLAQLARKNNVLIMYNPQIVIRHKEDGSTSSLGDNYNYVRESYLEYYKFWYKEKNEKNE